jgi:hypothetical protein
MCDRPKVLCIEDDAATVDVLEDGGFEAIIAFEGVEGVRLSCFSKTVPYECRLYAK